MKETKILYKSPEFLSRVLGLGFEVINIDDWEPEPNTNYLCIGQDTFEPVKSKVQLGLRGANFYMASLLKRVGVANGINFVFSYEGDWYINEAMEKLKDEHFEDPIPLAQNLPPLTYVYDVDTAVKVLNKLTALPVGTWFGYDYESKSFPDQNDFIATGLGIATLKHRYWIDFRFCMSTSRASLRDYKGKNDTGLSKLNEAHAKFLEKHSRHCIVFNVNFELIATYRYLGEFYEFRDLNATNVMRELGLYNNLKWSARYYCNVNSWDDKFEAFNDAFNDDECESPVCEWDNDWNITKVNYGAIKKRFDWITLNDIQEMQKHFEVCHNSFYIMPSQWLGYYCSLDAYYTLISWIVQLDRWNYHEPVNGRADMGPRLDKCDQFPVEARWKIMSEAALDVYCDGKIAESIVNNGGQLLDSKWWDYGHHICYSYLLFTTTHLSIYYLKYQMSQIKDRNHLSDYSEICQKFINLGYDITQEGYYLAKELIGGRYYDENYSGYLNENLVREDFGDEIGQQIIDTIWDCCDDVWMIGRKRKCLTNVGYILDDLFTISDDMMSKHPATVEYYQLKSNLKYYESLPWINDDIDHIRKSYVYDGVDTPIDSLTNILLGNLNINTLQGEIDNDVWYDNADFRFWSIAHAQEYDWELWDFYKYKDPVEDMKYFFSDEGSSHFSEETINYLRDLYNTTGDEGLTYALEHLVHVSTLKAEYKDVWEKTINPGIRTGHYEKIYEYPTITTWLRIWAKYFKIKTYYDGLYYECNQNYNKLDKFWMKDWDDTGEYHNDYNVLSFPKFTANKQFSYRWSANFHTVPSKNEVKRCTTSPDDSIFTYFDISSMEIRTIAYLSRDEKMIDLFEHGVDLYKYCARFMLGDEVWNSLDASQVKEYRTEFKQVLLAYFYRRGARSLAPELGKTVEETQAIMDSLGRTFPSAIEFRDYLSDYPVKHEGRLLTVFNETIISDEDRIDRQQKHGINTVIQSGSAVMLVYGFYNLMKQAWKKGWKFRSVGYVHDSSQSYFDINHLWEMSAFYYEHVTKFLWDRFRINFAFDIMCGTNYWDVGKLKQISDDVIQLSGSGITINNVMKRLKKNNIAFEIANPDDLKLDEEGYLIEDIHDTLDDFIDIGAAEATFRRDHSNYTAQLRKL